MTKNRKTLTKERRRSSILATIAALILSMLVGCGPSEAKLATVDYTPLPGDDWKVSTPEEQGLNPALVAELYLNATELETIYSLLVIKNGYLIAEGYFNDGSIEQLSARHSATKSYTSALVGIAMEQGCLSSLDQKMMDFFPEFANQVHATDPRKEQITIRHLLQMRAGYPYDSTDYYGDILFLSGNWRWLPHLVDFPLVNDPGTEANYSNVTSHILGVIVQRACDTDLKSFAQKHLFEPTGAELGNWTRDLDDYNWGWGEIYVTARDMAKFGLLYANDGKFHGAQVIPADWVHDSLQIYSEDAWITKKIGKYFKDNGYGYQWWSASVGKHDFNFAWGHGGQLIILLDKLDMIIVTTANPLNEVPPADGWKYEKTVIDLVGRFIKSLPGE
jgi:CubicO group peptidase (beta-lactamase class C family)